MRRALEWPRGDLDRPGGLQSPHTTQRCAEPGPGSFLPPSLWAQPQGPQRAGHRGSGLAYELVPLVWFCSCFTSLSPVAPCPYPAESSRPGGGQVSPPPKPEAAEAFFSGR